MKSILEGKTILITGGTGSIGGEIVTQALQLGAKKVIVFSRDEIKHFLMRKRIEDDRLETFVGDIRNTRSIEMVFMKYHIDIIYHAAAMKHVVMCDQFPLEAVETNIRGTQNLVDMTLKYKVSKMINISTDKAVYPINILGITKFAAEKIILNANKMKENSPIFASVRFGNVVNSRGSVIPVYIDNLLHNNPLEVTNPEVTRFFMEIPDAIRLVIKAADYAKGGEIFILKMKAFKLGDLVDVIVRRIAGKLNIPSSDVRLNITGLFPGEKLHEDLLSEAEVLHTGELEDMFVVLPDGSDMTDHLSLKRANSLKYNSENAEIINKEELENMVLKYLSINNII
ncbi:MAG: SDR family NAD(P)-dependent oxidoreductase [Eubacteriales bacterium]